ncbi:hypothetical protein OIDMADRAFT_195891, partial [Oidiodendron maius Zn]
MASVIGFVQRIWDISRPIETPKSADAVRIGLLGASTTAPLSLITPAKSHPGVVIAAVAARDFKKAEAFAKKHNIAKIHRSYQNLIDDPSIDVIYNPLPNGLHFEWAMRALRAGKHVLLEKPSVSNAAEANTLFSFHAE